MADSRTLPVDRLLGGYLLLTATALLFPHRPPGWALLLLVHVSLAAALLTGLPGRARDWATAGGESRLRGLTRIVADWYPLLLMPFLYWALPFLATAIRDGQFFDPRVIGWEETLFGHQPSRTLARSWDSLLLSELLHLAYLAYYPVIYFLPAVLYLRGRTEAFRATVFALMLGFTASYLFFIVFPVQGPRYLFPAPDGAGASGPLSRLTHAVLEAGSSRGAAFPSAHAALALVQTVNAGRYLPRALPALALVTAGIAVGAVYGGFHYAVDMAAGIALGAIVGWGAPRVRAVIR